MRTCSQCDEPAVKVAILRGAEREKKYLCYVHAATEGLMDLPMESLQEAADDSGYPIHGLIFVGEAVARADEVASAQEVIIAVLKSAKERFGASARSVMERWSVPSGQSIGEVFLALQAARLVSGDEGIRSEHFSEPLTLGDLLDVL